MVFEVSGVKACCCVLFKWLSTEIFQAPSCAPNRHARHNVRLTFVACAWGKQSPLIVHPGGRRAWSQYSSCVWLWNPGILRVQVNGANQRREKSALPAAVFELASHFHPFPSPFARPR
jgi:hypothetical protein